MATYIGNAFSLGMLDQFDRAVLNVESFSLARASEWVRDERPTSCVGHADTAALFTTLLGTTITMNRCSTNLVPGDRILVGQYNGPRLPEGATALPEGARIRWMLVCI